MKSLGAWSAVLLIPLLLVALSSCANTENDEAILNSLNQLKTDVGTVKAEVAAVKADQGHTAPAPAGPTAAEIQAMVQAAVPAVGPTAAEIQALIEATAPKAGPTATEIQALIEAAAPKAGPTTTEIQALIEAAAPKAGPSAKTIKTLVEAAILEVPKGLSSSDVEGIVAEAIAARPSTTTVEQVGTMPSRLLEGPINFTFSMLQSDDTWTSNYGDGTDFALNDIIGKGKPVVVNFLAAGCPPCWKELPAFQKVYNEHRDDIIMLGVDVGDSVGMSANPRLGDRAKLLAESGATFPVGVVSNAKLVVMYGLYKIPATITITGDGKLLRRDVKALSEDEINLRVDELLNL